MKTLSKVTGNKKPTQTRLSHKKIRTKFAMVIKANENQSIELLGRRL